jgi:hypothetical protein
MILLIDYLLFVYVYQQERPRDVSRDIFLYQNPNGHMNEEQGKEQQEQQGRKMTAGSRHAHLESPVCLIFHFSFFFSTNVYLYIRATPMTMNGYHHRRHIPERQQASSTTGHDDGNMPPHCHVNNGPQQ